MFKLIFRNIIKVIIISFIFLFFLILGNLYTYKRLTNEEPIAQLAFTPINSQEFDASLRLGNFCEEETYKIYGDEWRIDAQFLKWKSWAALLGINPLYRIERLSGRYSEIQDENSKHHSAHEIKPITTLNLSKLAEDYDHKFPFLDTVYGSSAYEKMKAETIFTVFRTQSGILIREQAESTAMHQNNCVKGKSVWKDTILKMDQSLASIVHSIQILPN